MSFPLMAQAIRSDIDDCYAKWLMVVLSDHADEETHQCWPSLDLLAKRTKMNRVTVTRKMNWLEENGWLTRKRGNSTRSTLYTIFPTAVAESNDVVAQSNPNLSYKPINKSMSQSPKRKVRLTIPDDWLPEESLMKTITEKAKGDIDHDYEVNQFRDYHNAKGSRFKDIGRAYQYWTNNRIKWNAESKSDSTSTGNKRSYGSRSKASFFGGIYNQIKNQ